MKRRRGTTWAAGSALACRALIRAVAAGAVIGCQGPPGPIFPPVSPEIVWPQRPDRPRIRYIGQLTGQANLGARPKGLDAWRQVLAGPQPQAAFVRPSAAAVAGERIFVADPGGPVVHVLDLKTRNYRAVQGNPAEPLRVPIDITIVDGGTLAVVDRGRAALDCFDLDGNWRSTRRWPELAAPVAIAWDEFARQAWMADAAAHCCYAIRGLTDIGSRLGERGNGPGQFNYPSALAAQPAVGLVVADAMNFRVQVFDQALQPVAIFGQKGDAAGDFARPRAVAVDSEGHIYVVDNQFENVQVFDRGGRLLMAFGQGGAGPGEFALPSGITIDTQDRIWIADSLNRRVQVFQYIAEGSS